MVGLVDDGSTFGSPQILMMSGAWPPPAPSVGRWDGAALHGRDLVSTKPDSFSVSVWIAT
jgi:hypothetical protein